MDLSYQKGLAAKLLKCSPGRVHVSQDKQVEEALTRNDIKVLITKGMIRKKPTKGTSRVKANVLSRQKRLGRRQGRGTRSGKKFSRERQKEKWITTVRALRRMLREMRDDGKLKEGEYLKLYRQVKGNEFRNKRHLLSHLKDKGLLLKKTEVKK